MGVIPTRKPRRRVINVRSLVHAFDGNERPYPHYTYSARRFFERPTNRPFALTVIVPAPGSIPTGTVGSAYSGLNWTASTATAPLTWSIIAGELPPGLTLNVNNGAISGLPTLAGVYAYTIEVTGAPRTGIQVGSLASSITVNP